MEYRHQYAREPRITLASLLLLAVFIAATAVIIYAIARQPWNTDDATVSAPSVEEPLIEASASEGLDGDLDVLIQPLAE